jgi:hypothetical protein
MKENGMLKKVYISVIVVLLCAFSQPVVAEMPPPPSVPSETLYKFQRIVIPGVEDFLPSGMNDRLDVVGKGRVGNRLVGILYNLVTHNWEQISPPDSCFVVPAGINNWRQVVGNNGVGRNGICEPAVITSHAFFRDWDGTFYELPLVQGAFFAPQGLNDLSKIVGSTVANREQQGVIIRCIVNKRANKLVCGEPDVFEVEGDQTFLTRVDDIANGGQFIGEILDHPQSNRQHGYSCSARGKCIIIDFPEALGTSTTGVNDRKDVVGFWYGDTGGTHSFIARVNGNVVEDFATIDPVELGAVSSFPADVNNSRVVVGIYNDGNPGLKAYVAWPSHVYDLVAGL